MHFKGYFVMRKELYEMSMRPFARLLTLGPSLSTRKGFAARKTMYRNLNP